MRRPAAVLLYRATCGKCRGLSLAVVLLSLGRIRRVPLSSPEARKFYEDHNVRPGKLALVGHRRVFMGWRAIPGAFLLPILAALSALKPR